MDVSRSSYYRWRKGCHKATEDQDQILLVVIRQLRQDRRKRCYGSRRLVIVLRGLGFVVGRKRVRRLMRQSGIIVVQRRAFRPKTTDSNHSNPIAPNRVCREFHVEAPNKVWAGDITYLRCGSGWIYLAVVIDLYSSRVIGWSI
jgi:transposase InsO family protein